MLRQPLLQKNKRPRLSRMSSQGLPGHVSTSPFFSLSWTGDVVLSFVYPKCMAQQPWVNRKRHKSPQRPAFHIRLPSHHLRMCGGYFSALCDPNKYQEGTLAAAKLRDLQTKYGNQSLEEALASASLEELPHIEVEFPPLTVANETELEATLKIFIMCSIVHSPGGNHLDGQESDDSDDEIWFKSPIICNLIILTDRFESSSLFKTIFNKDPPFMEEIFTMIHKARSSKKEQSLRQAIFSACRLSNYVLGGSAIKQEVIRELTGRLIIRGSEEWYNPRSEIPGIDREIWWEIPDGIEAEMKYRHQCIIDTIDNLQAHFLRAYGAYIPCDPATSSNKPRSLQCRRMYENSRACDSFHLGEIVRFFSQRIKTINIASALSDIAANPDYEEDTENGGEQERVAPNDIRAILASLRSVPEYQIDDNHVGCGVRRQLVPAVTAIESCLGSCGICIAEFTPSSYPSDGWRIIETIKDKKSIENFHVNVSTNGKINFTPFPGGNLCDCIPRAAYAQVLFTAKDRVRWPGWTG